MDKVLNQLIEASWQEVSRRSDPRSGACVSRPPIEILEQARLESRFGDDFPVLAHFEAALDLLRHSEFSTLAGVIDAARESLRWSQNPGYDEGRGGRALLDGYAYAGLSGPDCPQLCEVPRAGYMLMAPEIEYIDHCHAAREIYLVLTPGTLWRLDGGAWFPVEAGQMIVHESWQMHAMRTTRCPMLAFVAWLDRGDRTAIRI